MSEPRASETPVQTPVDLQGSPTQTTQAGVQISDDQNSEKLGHRGPTLLEDFVLREKITHFDHERIPERVVHARGSGAHGVFTNYEPLNDLTKAGLFAEAGKETPVFVRFSTVAGFRGSADTARDVRGFAVKFYTDEGNWDLVGNNMPVFFIQDAIKFPDLIHAVKPEPNNEIPQASSAHDTFYDFISLTPESLHMIMWIHSDRAIPRSFATMEGFGVHTFRLVNAEGKSRFVKFHWKPLKGMHSLAWDEAQQLAGKDPDFHRRDLWEAIDRGDFPEYEFGIQVIEESQEFDFDFDILDATKLWPEDLVPVQRIGKLTLNRNPENFFAETEQVAFLPTNIVPGIDFSNDPLLQGRLFSYIDTQLTRLGGPNWQQLPINRPRCPFATNQRDGHMQMGIPKGRVSYFPNGLDGNQPDENKERGFVSYPERVEGVKIRERSPSFSDHVTQAALFFHSLEDWEKQHLIAATRFELSKCDVMDVRERMVTQINRIDHDYAVAVAPYIGVAIPEPVETPPVKKAKGLSLTSLPTPSIKGMKVGILAGPDAEVSALKTVKDALEKESAVVEIVAVDLSLLDGMPPRRTLLNTPSVTYDAIYVVGGDTGVASLSDDDDAVRFIRDAYKHGKPVAACGNAAELVAGALPKSEGVSPTTKGNGLVLSETHADQGFADAFVKTIAAGRVWSRGVQAPPSSPANKVSLL
ncbi:catalase [soil metagenome]